MMSHLLSGHRAIAPAKYDGGSQAIALNTVESLFDLYRCILPTQIRRQRRDSSELRLLVALMINAINEYLGLEGPTNPKDRVMLRRAAELWFDGDPGARLPFERCCELLGLDPDLTRRAIERLAALRLQTNGGCESTVSRAPELEAELLTG